MKYIILERLVAGIFHTKCVAQFYGHQMDVAENFTNRNKAIIHLSGNRSKYKLPLLI